MKRTWKLAALALLAALGFAVGAYAKPARWRPPTTTVTTTTAAPTTPATTVVSTTTPPTTTTTPVSATTPTTTTTPPQPSSMRIVSPVINEFYSRGSTATAVADVQSSTGGVACSIDWGDATPPSTAPAVAISPDVYRCYATHLYLGPATGFLTVRFTATGADGTVIAEDSVQVIVL